MATVKRTIHTGFTVDDLERSSRFFRDCLGLAVSAPRSPPSAEVLSSVTGVAGAQARIAMVSLPGHEIELLQYSSPTSATASAPRPCDVGFAHLALEVDDVAAVVAAARGHGFALGGDIFPSVAGPFAGKRVAYIRDPHGFTLELIGD